MVVTFPSLEFVFAAPSFLTPSVLFWEADLYELYHPDYLAPELLWGFTNGKY